jgi:hypothetical protein
MIQKGDYVINVYNDHKGQPCTSVYFKSIGIVQIEFIDDLDKIVNLVKTAIS